MGLAHRGFPLGGAIIQYLSHKPFCSLLHFVKTLLTDAPGCPLSPVAPSFPGGPFIDVFRSSVIMSVCRTNLRTLPSIPEGPGGPCGPGAPSAPEAPGNPEFPAVPGFPLFPILPLGPRLPWSPRSPWRPRFPLGPGSPSCPGEPGSPFRPAGPEWPGCPARYLVTVI